MKQEQLQRKQTGSRTKTSLHFGNSRIDTAEYRVECSLKNTEVEDTRMRRMEAKMKGKGPKGRFHMQLWTFMKKEPDSLEKKENALDMKKIYIDIYNSKYIRHVFLYIMVFTNNAASYIFAYKFLLISHIISGGSFPRI